MGCLNSDDSVLVLAPYMLKDNLASEKNASEEEEEDRKTKWDMYGS